MQIDIVIPCYNYGRHLRGCVESALSQQGVSVRILIIDDCSPDNTPEVGRTLAAEDSRVEYRRHEVNQRHIATYNEGFEWASSDATLLLSADDLLLPGALARAATVLEGNSAVGLVCGRQIVFSDCPPLPAQDRPWNCHIHTGADFIAQMCHSGSNPICTPTAVVRTAILKQVGGYRRELPHTADMEYWLRVAARSDIAVVSADQAYKRMHGQNMQLEFVAQPRRDLEQCLAAFKSFFAYDGHLLPNARDLHQQARRAVAGHAFWAASKEFDRTDAGQCQALLEFAATLDPSLPRQRSWSRLAWKRRLGSRIWPYVQKLLDHFRPLRDSV